VGSTRSVDVVTAGTVLTRGERAVN